jgi:hypothetical protein
MCGAFEWQQDISLENGRTNEKMVIKRGKDMQKINQKVTLISRYPLLEAAAAKKWIEENEKEILDWKLVEQHRRISLNRFNFEVAI